MKTRAKAKASPKMTAEQAKVTPYYLIVQENFGEFKIKKTTFYDHVIDCVNGLLWYEKTPEGYYTITGKSYLNYLIFTSEEEAKDFIFSHTYSEVFDPKTERGFFDYQKAIKQLNECVENDDIDYW